jgi:hypothetical protein
VEYPKRERDSERKVWKIYMCLPSVGGGGGGGDGEIKSFNADTFCYWLKSSSFALSPCAINIHINLIFPSTLSAPVEMGEQHTKKNKADC